MPLIVQKYGGSSVANPGKLNRVAQRIAEEYRKGNQVVVVVSAMGDTTDHLVELAHQVSTNPPEREMDMLLSVGERISIALLSMALNQIGIPAISFTGSQVGIITDDKHTNARILEIRAHRIREELEKGRVVVVAGFQGVSIKKEITTLGRGGSDTTAVALAAALNADRCELMKDVEGVYVVEPNLVPKARLNSQISYDEMIEMSNLGAEVLKAESVELAKQYGVKIAIGSTESGRVNTIITDHSLDSSGVRGIIGQKGMCWVRMEFKTPKPLFQLNRLMGEQRIKVQAYHLNRKKMDVVFHEEFLSRFKPLINPIEELIENYQENQKKAIVGIVGTGLNFNSDIARQIFEMLPQLKIDIDMLQVSELKISWVQGEDNLEKTIAHLYKKLIPHPAKIGV